METRSLTEKTEVRIDIKNLNVTMKNQTFDGTYAIPQFEFLTQFVNDADTLDISEVQVFVASPIFLASQGETQFRDNLSGSSRYGGVTCLPEAIQYCARTHHHSNAGSISCEAIRDRIRRDISI